MWRQLASCDWHFWPPPRGRGLWRCFIMGGCFLFSTIAATAEDEAAWLVTAPEFAVIEIAVRPGEKRTPLLFTVKLAETEAQRRHGLMFTPFLPEHHGMLFLFENDAPRQFWMKNTQIPLDILFFDSHGRLLNIVRSALPFSLTMHNSAGPARYVLELNGGVAEKIGVQPDAQLVLPLAGQ